MYLRYRRLYRLRYCRRNRAKVQNQWEYHRFVGGWRIDALSTHPVPGPETPAPTSTEDGCRGLCVPGHNL